MLNKVAALFVATNGIYFGRDDVDPWDEPRNALRYTGPWPVVAHPPCGRWCRMAPLVQKTHGYRVGDDGGAFQFAVVTVRWLGGILEHPELSYAFEEFGLGKPPKSGGWIPARSVPGYICHVEQGHYGHRARKATWLYSAGCTLPELKWGRSSATAYVTDGGGNVKRRWSGNVDPTRKRLSKREASATPPEFAELLLSIARTGIGIQ